MKGLRLLFLSLFVSVSALFAKEGEAKEEKNIRVLIHQQVQEALLEVRGPYYILNPYDQARVSSGLFGKRFMVRSTQNGMRWGGEFPGVHQLAIVPRSPKTTILLNGVQYDGVLNIYKTHENTLNIVNELPIDEYLKATLTEEFDYPLESEVMAAVAIAARTKAFYQVQKGEQNLWDVKEKECSYRGSSLIIPDSFVVQAVKATKNLIMLHSAQGKQTPFAAAWTEHSAGKTAAFNTIFRKDGAAPTIGIEAEHAKLDRNSSKWQLQLSKRELANLLDLSAEIQSIDLFIDPASGKTYGCRITTAQEKKDFDFFTLQRKIGKNRLLSNDLSVCQENGQIKFSGFGKGHGVGLCIYSASAMAQNGEMAVQLLSKFFPNTYLVNLSALPNTTANK